MQWDGLTDRGTFGDPYLEERDRFSDRARDADWNGVFAVLGEHPEWWTCPGPATAAASPHCTRRPGTARSVPGGHP